MTEDADILAEMDHRVGPIVDCVNDVGTAIRKGWLQCRTPQQVDNEYLEKQLAA